MHRNRPILMAAACLLLAAAAALSKSADEFWMYVGTYTGKGSEGIYAYRFDASTGALKSVGLAAKLTNPSFLTISPDNKVLYAISEVGRDGAVSSYTVNASTGALTPVNHVSTKGAGPCFVGTDKTGRTVLVANYGGGSVASFRADSGGRLSEAVSFFQHTGSSVNPGRQKEPHAHSFNAAPDNHFAIAADLGTDQLYVYRLDAATAQLTANDPPSLKVTPGDGPRHLAFHPNARFAYAINELHNTVTALEWNAKAGTLKTIESVPTLPADFKGQNSTAEVQVHPTGKWVYGSNRGHDSIAVFDVDAKSGKLRLVQNAPTGGKTPRNFRLDPTGRWLVAANMDGNSLRVFRIDAKSGQLSATGELIPLVSPVCVKFVPVQ